MTREEAVKWLKDMPRKYFHGGDERFDELRKEAINMAIEALKAQKWTPVNEKLPEKEGRYWVWAEKSFVPDHADEPNRYQGSTEADFMGGKWYGRDVEEVIAWMPLPKPY